MRCRAGGGVARSAIRPMLLSMKTLRILAGLLVLSTISLRADAPSAATPNVTNVTVNEAEKLLKAKPGVVILDVRTADEFKAGHIPGAKNVDFLDDHFSKGVAALDPATPILVHCASGGRSSQAISFLKDKKTVYHLRDGFNAWEKAGKPVETGDKPEK